MARMSPPVKKSTIVRQPSIRRLLPKGERSSGFVRSGKQKFLGEFESGESTTKLNQADGGHLAATAGPA
jgi:hypothetical protein